MYAIFIRDNRQQIYSKVSVTDKIEAFRKFEEMIRRKELYGRKLIGVIMHQETVKTFHSFIEEKCERTIRMKLTELENILSIENQSQSIENQFIDMFEARSMVNYRFPV
ncbi:MAG: hypothetical protein KF908_15165 [Nitrosomonas sp.]|nr:hypothetical protein [Nitrosomonas sp.]MCW5608987.1 hypothetical protein [Nitrosomonas sp.]